MSCIDSFRFRRIKLLGSREKNFFFFFRRSTTTTTTTTTKRNTIVLSIYMYIYISYRLFTHMTIMVNGGIFVLLFLLSLLTFLTFLLLFLLLFILLSYFSYLLTFLLLHFSSFSVIYYTAILLYCYGLVQYSLVPYSTL